MPKVICKLPNASNSMGGVSFTDHPDNAAWKVSEEISAAHAAEFASINGFELVGAKSTAPAGGGGESEDAETARLRARAIELKIPNAAQMGLAKLRERVADAEAEASKNKPPVGTGAPAGGEGAAPDGSGQ